MKQKIALVVVIVLIFNIILTSCSSGPIQLDESVKVQESMHGLTPSMEFIGFKGTPDILGSDYDMWQKFKKDTAIAKFGDVLESKGVAYNKSFAYFGIYSLQELAAYTSQKRYVTFIETEKNHFTYRSDSERMNKWFMPVFASVGGLLATGGLVSTIALSGELESPYNLIPLLGVVLGAPTLIFGFTLGKEAYTIINFSGAYTVYVYDSLTKEIIYKNTVIVGPLENKFKGDYNDSDTDKNAVLNYYATTTFNSIIKEYDAIYKFLETRK